MKPTLTLLTALLLLPLAALQAAEFYVAPNGNDANPGMVQQPVATLDRATVLAHQAAIAGAGPVVVRVHGGIYRLTAPWKLSAANCGTLSSPIVFEAVADETPVISGAEVLSGLRWEPVGNGIFKTKLPTGTMTDQLVVNGQRQHLARYPNATPGVYMGGTTSLADINKRAAQWKHPVAGSFVHGRHKNNWGSSHAVVTGIDGNGSLVWRGGQQVNFQPGFNNAALFIEGVRDELDTPGEWFLDRSAGELYSMPPVGIELEKATVEIVRIRSLLRLEGSPEKPIHHVIFRGLSFQWTDRTFMDTKEPLLRGDWCIAREGALFIQDAEDVSIENCRFEHLGGNAVFVSRHARRVNVRANEFSHLDASAVCLVGDPSAVREPSFWNHHVAEPADLAPGPKNESYPKECAIEDNLMHDFGLLEKQTAGVLISMSEMITVRHNTIYNCPRAGICINDGTWGGHLIADNDVFATVRETGDHGPFNSWGRDRHWIGSGVNGPHVKERCKLDNRTPTITDHNRFAHYWSNHSWGIDLDDGSSNYILRNNLTLGCSIKLREGCFRTVENNICVYVHTPGKHCCYEANEDVILGNIFVNIRGTVGQDMIHAYPSWARTIDSNLYYNTAGKPPMIHLAGRVENGLKAWMTFAEWQAKGFDTHSLVGNPLFINPAADDYRVGPDSPALKLGFKNFAMDNFGTQAPGLKSKAAQARERYDKAHGEIVMALQGGTQKPAQAIQRGDDNRTQWLGATIKDLAGMAELSASGLSEEIGVLVIEVPPGSPADKAGLRAADVILRVNGTAISGINDLLKHTREKTSLLSLWRNQKPVEGIRLEK